MFQNHFWSVGFQIASSQEYRDLALLALKHARVMAEHGDLQFECWSMGKVELWLQTRQGTDISARRILDLNPHYAGKSTCELQLERQVHRPRKTPLDHSYVAWVSEDEYPLVFDAPCVIDEPAVPSKVGVQMTAFAHNIDVFESELVYEEHRAKKKGWASKAFVPCGMFEPNGEKIEPPDSMAIIVGVIQDSAEEKNPHTGNTFQWALISSHKTDYDIVVGPDVCEQRLVAGNVVVGTFWLSGALK